MAVKAGTNKDKAATTAKPEVKTRKTLTHAERIEKAKADLAALEAKVAQANEKKVSALDERIAGLKARGEKIAEQVTALEAERKTLVGDDEDVAPAEASTTED